MAELRDYQQKLADEIIAAIDAGHRPMAQAATGAGKSWIMAAVARHYLQQGIRVLVCTHRREIALQQQETLRIYTGIEPALISAEGKPNWDSPLIVGMVPTIARRLKTTPSDRVGLVLLDEGHHSSAPGWGSVIDRLAAPRLAGCSATPVSCNRTPLSTIFDKLLIGPPSRLLVEDGHLAPVRLLAAQHGIDVRGVHIRQGDYAIGELEQRAAAIAAEIVPTWRKYNPDGLATLVACCSIAHSQEVARLYQQEGIRAQHIDGTTPTKERDRILQDFAQGRITLLTFVSLIDEGLDIPSASVLQFLRPTKSLRLRRQLEGRIRRPHPGKMNCTIIDHSDSWQHLPLPDEELTWRLDRPNEEGARRSGDFVAERQPNGEIVMVPATFREIVSPSGQLVAPPVPKKASKPSLVRSRLDSGDRDFQEHLLQQVKLNQRYRFGCLAGMSADPCASLRHFQLVGHALGFKPAWAHHQFRKAVILRTSDRHRAEIQRVLDQAMKSWASTAPQPEPRRSRLKGLDRLPPSPLQPGAHPLHADGWVWPDGKAGIPLLGYGQQGEASPLPPWEHAAARAKLEPLLAEAFPGGYVLAGLWGNQPIPQLERIIEFGVLA